MTLYTPSFEKCSPFDLLAISIDYSRECNFAEALKYLKMSMELSIQPEYSSESETFIRLHCAAQAYLKTCMDEKNRDETKDGFVYFIQNKSNGHIKIGHSEDTERRLKTLQIGNSGDLEIIGKKPGDAKLEAKIHKQFADFNINGEWFLPSESILSFIETNNE